MNFPNSLLTSFSINNINTGFSKCGIYPLNRDAVAKAKMLPSVINYQNLNVLENLKARYRLVPVCTKLHQIIK